MDESNILECESLMVIVFRFYSLYPSMNQCQNDLVWNVKRKQFQSYINTSFDIFEPAVYLARACIVILLPWHKYNKINF